MILLLRSKVTKTAPSLCSGKCSTVSCNIRPEQRQTGSHRLLYLELKMIHVLYNMHSGSNEAEKVSIKTTKVTVYMKITQILIYVEY